MGHAQEATGSYQEDEGEEEDREEDDEEIKGKKKLKAVDGLKFIL